MAFERLQEKTDAALRDAQIRDALGEIATELLDINERIFLPNYRDGKFFTPKEQHDTRNLAVIPMTAWQARTAGRRVQPLLSDTASYRYESVDDLPGRRSTVYGIEVGEELEASYHDLAQRYHPVRRSEADTLGRHRVFSLLRRSDGLGENTTARTTVENGISFDNQGQPSLYSSRPVTVIRDTLATQPYFAAGAIMAHEEVHASDVLRDGVAYFGHAIAAATELRAYYVQAQLSRRGQDPSLAARKAFRVEATRLALADPNQPFVPTDALRRALYAGKVVSLDEPLH